MTSSVSVVAPPPIWPEQKWGRRLLGRLATLPARLRSAARCLALSRRLFHHAGPLFRPPVHRDPQEVSAPLAPKPAVFVGMDSAILWGGPYCGDEISVPADAPRLTRPDGSVYLRSSLTDSGGRPVFMLRLGRRTLDLPRQSDLS